ncbi:MAG: hypothetical protein KDD53_08985 [Bdellovibrionales bacterium]|nr:hypothetical protein [Bdellovibrionales bacterium]
MENYLVHVSRLVEWPLGAYISRFTYSSARTPKGAIQAMRHIGLSKIGCCICVVDDAYPYTSPVVFELSKAWQRFKDDELFSGVDLRGMKENENLRKVLLRHGRSEHLIP